MDGLGLVNNKANVCTLSLLLTVAQTEHYKIALGVRNELCLNFAEYFYHSAT